MARPLRIAYPGALYHVTSRGNQRERIFLDDRDRRAFFEILASVVERCNWRCHAYCLMDNHYHLVIETPDGNLSYGMRQLNGIYTQQYNRAHHTVGHLLQGRFKSILIDKESYLLELCRYVVLNPLRAHLVSNLSQWPWSSYGATAGDEKVPTFLNVDWILSQFGRSKKRAQAHYRDFVIAGRETEAPWKKLRGRTMLGSDEFVAQMQEKLTEKSTVKEIPRVERFVARPAFSQILTGAKDKRERDHAIYHAYVKHGYTLSEIGDFLGIHYSTVCKAVKKIEGGKKENNSKFKA